MKRNSIIAMVLSAIAFATAQDTTATPTTFSSDDDITTTPIASFPNGNITSTPIAFTSGQNATATSLFAPTQNVTITTTTARPTSSKGHNVPGCVYQCLLQAAQYSGCSINNKNCACSDMDFQQISHSCVAANCTLAEQASITSIEQKCAGATRAAGSRTAELAAASATNVAITNGGHVGWAAVATFLGTVVASGFFGYPLPNSLLL